MASMDDLAKVRSQKFIHLTTKGRKTGRPHTVELWFALGEGKVYLSHEGSETDWMKNLKQNGQVSFEIGGKNFTGKAHYSEESNGRSLAVQGCALREVLWQGCEGCYRGLVLPIQAHSNRTCVT